MPPNSPSAIWLVIVLVWALLSLRISLSKLHCLLICISVQDTRSTRLALSNSLILTPKLLIANSKVSCSKVCATHIWYQGFREWQPEISLSRTEYEDLYTSKPTKP